MRKWKFFPALLFLLGIHTLQAQVGIGTTTPHPSAVLDVSSTSRGFLLPRMTTAQRTAIAAPATSLIVYQTDGTKGFYYYNGSAWVLLNFNYVLQQNLNTNGKYLSGDGGNNGLLLQPNGIVLGKGTFAAGSDLTEAGAGTKLIWYPKKAAFRAGGITSTQWDNVNIGAYSAAFGFSNSAKGSNSFSVGYQNTSSNLNAVTMGYQNTASGTTSAAIGYRCRATGTHSIAIGDSAIAQGINAVSIGYKTVASGNYATAFGQGAQDDVKGMFVPNTASGEASTVMGSANVASGTNATVIGGNGNDASGTNSVAGGASSIASGFDAFAMGTFVSASGDYSLAYGFVSNASGSTSTAMGSFATASGGSSVALGDEVEASGNNSVALGTAVSTNLKNGSFAFGDANITNTVNDADNQMLMRFSGGYKLYSNAGLTAGVRVLPGGNAWSTVSDKARKENFAPVDADGVLKKIAAFNLSTWNYKGQDARLFRHYGPMAQEFFAAFGKDRYGAIGNDTTINQADFDGINLIAIQALEKRTTELKSQNEELAKQNAALQQNLVQLQAAFREQQAYMVQRLQKLEAAIAVKQVPGEAVAAK